MTTIASHTQGAGSRSGVAAYAGEGPAVCVAQIASQRNDQEDR